MKYLLDTNICIYIISERPMQVLEHFARLKLTEIGVSSITAAELAFGIAKSRSVRNRAALEAVLLPLEIANFDLTAAFAYGDLRAELERPW